MPWEHFKSSQQLVCWLHPSPFTYCKKAKETFFLHKHLSPQCVLCKNFRRWKRGLRLQDQRIKPHMGTEEPGSPLLSRLKAVHGEDTARRAKSMESVREQPGSPSPDSESELKRNRSASAGWQLKHVGPRSPRNIGSMFLSIPISCPCFRGMGTSGATLRS